MNTATTTTAAITAMLAHVEQRRSVGCETTREYDGNYIVWIGEAPREVVAIDGDRTYVYRLPRDMDPTAPIQEMLAHALDGKRIH